MVHFDPTHTHTHTHTQSAAFILLFISGTQSSERSVHSTFLEVVDDAGQYASDTVQQLYEIFCQLLFGRGVLSAIIEEFDGEISSNYIFALCNQLSLFLQRYAGSLLIVFVVVSLGILHFQKNHVNPRFPGKAVNPNVCTENTICIKSIQWTGVNCCECLYSSTLREMERKGKPAIYSCFLAASNLLCNYIATARGSLRMRLSDTWAITLIMSDQCALL